MSWTTTAVIPTPENLERVLLCWSDVDSEWPSSHMEELEWEDTSYSENVMIFSSRKLNEMLRENIMLRNRITKLEDALINISEYWNRDRNDEAMHDACWHSIETALNALEGSKE